MGILIQGVRIVDARGAHEGDVSIDGSVIAEVGHGLERKAGDRVIDGRGKAVIPGLINTHTHAAMVLLRSYADDLALSEWLKNRIWPLEKKLTSEDVRIGTRLACLEMVRSGTTTFNDMYFHGDSVARAAEELGVRACVSEVLIGDFQTGRIEEGLERLKARRNVIPAVGPHAAYSVSLDMLKNAAALAERHDARVHFHLAETREEVDTFRAREGKGLVEALDEIGFLSPRLLAAHGVWLDEREISQLARRGVSVSHCPASNMKLCAGKALDYETMERHSLNVTLGTDGAASNNNLDMFESMKFAALLQKHHYGNPARLSAREAFRMATVNGARALGIHAGLIEPGYLADVALLDLERPCFTPDHDILSNIVYAARGDCVDTVIVGGRIVMENGRVEGERTVLEEARKTARDLVNR
ncbi:MAG: amidohydrolase [Planctomycetes bacterium]|nr:amidohydrolase [Planctomycetota bacterium]